MLVQTPLGRDRRLSTILCLHQPKEHFLSTLEHTAADIISFPQALTLLPLSTFLSLSNFPSWLLSLLFCHHFPHFSISLPFLLGPCCPRGVWDRLGGSLYVPLSWPELPSWGSFDGVGDYSSCSLGRIPLSHSSSSITCIYRHTHKGTLLKNKYTNISYPGICTFSPCHTLMLGLLLFKIL